MATLVSHMDRSGTRLRDFFVPSDKDKLNSYTMDVVPDNFTK